MDFARIGLEPNFWPVSIGWFKILNAVKTGFDAAGFSLISSGKK